MSISPIKFVNKIAGNIQAYKSAKAADAINDFARGFNFAQKANGSMINQKLVQDTFTASAQKHGKLTAFWQGITQGLKNK